jgi:1,2-diacylglycerol 3-beta-galactosyltransferase
VQKIQDVIFDEKSIGSVAVEGLGFVTRMAEYMVASDVLVSKAGPGTISEAAALSLPVLLTSFLPGQEEGNVDFVIDGGFGAFVSDSDPNSVADVVVSWLTDEEKMEALSNAAKEKGAPYAARDIVKAIGESTLKWREINEEREAARSSESPPSRN